MMPAGSRKDVICLKLILLDLDDTLLRSDKTISDYSIQVLHQCQQKGMLVGFVTARGETNILNHIERVCPDLVISSGGALVRYRNEILHSCQISQEETRMLIESAKDQYEITVDTLEGHFWNYKEKPQMSDWGTIIYTDYQEFSSPSLKVCIELPNEELARKTGLSLNECHYVKFANNDWYQFTHKDATKQKAIARTGELLGIVPAEMIAFGDDFGDMEMLAYCGVGAAMGNAIMPVKEIADIVIGTNDEDGVAHYLEQTYLNM